VSIKLHSDVTAKLNLTVKAKGGDEAPKSAQQEEPEEKGFRAKPKARHSK
jgi:hypothetical protein